MIMFAKCNCCVHNEVCSKKPLYEGVCRDIKSVLTETRSELISGNLRCRHFVVSRHTTNDDLTTNKE